MGVAVIGSAAAQGLTGFNDLMLWGLILFAALLGVAFLANTLEKRTIYSEARLQRNEDREEVRRQRDIISGQAKQIAKLQAEVLTLKASGQNLMDKLESFVDHNAAIEAELANLRGQ